LFYVKIRFNNSVDKNMTVFFDDFVQIAETHAGQGKKNFLHVDIMLKS